MLNNHKINSTSVDLIRICAIFSVIIIHTCSVPFKSYSENFIIFGSISSFTRWCVPVFFMLTGALLITKEEPISVFFKKRATKIIIPLIAWSYIYIVFAKFFSHLDPLHANPSVFTNPLLLLKYPAYFHLWFLYAIVSVYIAIPFLRSAFSNYNNTIALYVVALWFVSTSMIPYLNASGIPTPSLYLIKFNIIADYVGMGLLGLLLIKNINRFSFTLSIAIFVFGFISTAYLTLISSIDKASELYQGYTSPNVIIMSVGAFLVIYKIGERLANNNLCKLIKLLGGLSFGIYLSHMIIMPLVWRMPFMSNEHVTHSNYPILSTFISAFCTLTISALLSFLLSKTPLIKKIV
ncbi:acyltransferase [Escherichia coli]